MGKIYLYLFFQCRYPVSIKIVQSNKTLTVYPILLGRPSFLLIEVMPVDSKASHDIINTTANASFICQQIWKLFNYVSTSLISNRVEMNAFGDLRKATCDKLLNYSLMFLLRTPGSITQSLITGLCGFIG